MGTFTVSLQIGPLSGERFTEVEALVDTGTTYSTFPESVLTQLGVERHGYRRFELADNRVVEYPVGEARMRLQGDELTVLVVFTPDDSAPLLGATALEIFGLAVDPVKQQLIPIPSLLK